MTGWAVMDNSAIARRSAYTCTDKQYSDAPSSVPFLRFLPNIRYRVIADTTLQTHINEPLQLRMRRGFFLVTTDKSAHIVLTLLKRPVFACASTHFFMPPGSDTFIVAIVERLFSTHTSPYP